MIDKAKDFDKLVAANRILAREDVVDAFGHVSLRHPDNPSRYVMSRSRSPELVEFLHAAGVILIGIDTPSVDPQDDKELLSHAAVAERDLSLLEGLVLGGVQAGTYLLAAFPLRLEGADASPVRAVLMEEA